MDDLFNNVKKLMDSGNIPPEMQQMINNLKSSNQNNNSNSSQNMDMNNLLGQISPEMINNLSSMLNSNSSDSNSSTSSQNNFNLDMNTIMKMKSIMENMNNKNDPRANLLYSLKPYLRDSKKNKVDQYVNMLNISKIADFMNKPNNDNKGQKGHD